MTFDDPPWLLMNHCVQPQKAVGNPIPVGSQSGVDWIPPLQSHLNSQGAWTGCW